MDPELDALIQDVVHAVDRMIENDEYPSPLVDCHEALKALILYTLKKKENDL